MIEDLSEFKTSAYDDYCYTNMDKLREPVTEIYMYKFYQHVANIVSGLDRFLDMGCGSGNFEQVLPVGKIYVGIDHCSEALEIAQRNSLRDRPHFLESELIPFMTAIDLRLFDTFVFIEVLEHIVDDTKLINMIPPGKRVLITVPNYYSGGHVRYFESLNEVVDRYDMLTLEHSEEYKYPGSAFYILLGVTK